MNNELSTGSPMPGPTFGRRLSSGVVPVAYSSTRFPMDVREPPGPARILLAIAAFVVSCGLLAWATLLVGVHVFESDSVWPITALMVVVSPAVSAVVSTVLLCQRRAIRRDTTLSVTLAGAVAFVLLVSVLAGLASSDTPIEFLCTTGQILLLTTVLGSVPGLPGTMFAAAWTERFMARAQAKADRWRRARQWTHPTDSR
ncbi:MAG: hypothetical protein IPK87_12810 [Planctomycetes bacterium]|nr:hypothetical protein [Planctomycetota bacterium]